jgi:hypothetical protein
MGLIVTYACATMGIIGMWLVPSEYDFGQVLGIATLFFDAQKSGIINAQVRPAFGRLRPRQGPQGGLPRYHLHSCSPRKRVDNSL